MNKQICNAVRSKKLFQFYYNGGQRTVEPYCYAISRNGNELLRAFQISGYSASGKAQGWKLFSVNDMNNLLILDDTFNALRPEYNPDDPVMVRIYCCI